MYLEIFQTASAENGLGVTLTGICDTFSSLIWDVEYFSPGKFEVYVSANADTIALFRRGNIVGRSDDKRHYGIIEGVYLRTDAENGDYLTISGRFLMCLLSRRIITPTLSFTAYRTYGEIVQTAVQKNCITPWTAAERGIPSLKIGAVSGDCWEIKNVLQVSYENLMDWLYTVCRNIGGTANIRLREVDTGKYAMFLELSQGTDRSIMQRENMPVVFSDAYDNLLTYIYNSDYSEYRNYAYIYGEGEGIRRQSAACYSGEKTPTGLSRYEIYVNASDLSQTIRNDDGSETVVSDSEYKEMLRERGTENLVAPVLSSEATIVTESHQFVYGKDYQVGDFVTMQHTGYGIQIPRVRLVGMIESFDSEGYGLTPVVQE